MASRHILQHTSFYTLDEEQKNIVRSYASRKSILPPINITEIFNHQKSMSITLDFWDKKISTIKPAIVQYTPKDELFFAFYLFSARYQLDYALAQGHTINFSAEQLKICANLINVSANNLKIVQDDYITTALEWMGAFNQSRLYWVWAGRDGLVGSIIALFPDDFFNKLQALEILDIPVVYTGILSWALYYFRFCIRLYLLVRHSFENGWMSQDEKDIPFNARINAQWNIYKFDLLNDFFWASANLACFFWLYGDPIANYYGGVITSILLLMDVSLTLWNYSEEKLQFKKDMVQFDLDIESLTAMDNMDAPLRQMIIAKRQCKLDWDYKLYSLFFDVLYAVSLLIAFSLLCVFFLPNAWFPESIVLACQIVGTVMCFSLNTLIGVLKRGVDVCKSIEVLHFIEEDYKDVKDSQNKSIELQLLDNDWLYQQDNIVYQKMVLLRAFSIDTMVPIAVFFTLVFLPLVLSVPILTVSFSLAVMSYYTIESHYKPDSSQLPEVNPYNNYVRIRENPIVKNGFFRGISDSLREHRESYSCVMS